MWKVFRKKKALTFCLSPRLVPQKLLWLRRHFSLKVASNAWLRCHGCGLRGRTTYHLCGVKQRFLLERFCFFGRSWKETGSSEGALKFKWNIKPAAGNTQRDTGLPCTDSRISVCYRNKLNRTKLKPSTLGLSLAVEIRRNRWFFKHFKTLMIDLFQNKYLKNPDWNRTNEMTQ